MSPHMTMTRRGLLGSALAGAAISATPLRAATTP